ncbi:methyltransferase-like protein 7A isoform X2 [Python bivittatus]|uniref:Methyltransferase-like protein 7A isoform X2 n=1 Tax=Python bivittatus TaxID=176946 RepID=A0A9F2WJ28_PYTBI|nr:methyltransferase-like protein 7A isoform X2 [Python bivittatus]
MFEKFSLPSPLTMLIFLLQRCLQLLVLLISVLSYLDLWDPICKKSFPHLMKRFSKLYNGRMHKEKETLFRNMKDFADPSGKLHLLEIGVGTGTNFKFYPSGSRVTCVDYNPNFEKFLLESMAKNTHLEFENFNFVVTSAEDLSSVPDSSVDVVVGTLLLCSVANVKAALKEVLRVLRPGGAYYFIEHVAADRSTWTYFWQQICDPAWGYLGEGCSVLRETWKDLENAEFSKLNLQHMAAPLVVPVVCPHIYGYAMK